MGVMSCNRKNCYNIMCERFSNEYGYICNRCFEELISKGPETNIEEFMKTSPIKVNEKAARARFEVEFPNIR